MSVHVSVKVNFHQKDILILYILIYLQPHAGIKQHKMDGCSYSCIYMHKTMGAAFQLGTKTACYILILCFSIGTVFTEPCKSIQTPEHFSRFVASQPGIKLYCLRVCLISFTEHTYNFEDVLLTPHHHHHPVQQL